ncbi:hypothetical protein [Terriglobus tenax]|uniref:hypothetical protein n=1 Tax=Terriglobus tenax TaxID=1111115 RepID=UPI0021E0463F|nr:hypothetical protein [Terriglobus tenax]
MKAGLVQVALALLLSGSALAQNTFPTTGNVGIGTTSPVTTLDVNGAVRSSGTSGFVFSSNSYVWLKETWGLNVGLGGDDASYSANFVTQSGNSVMNVRADGRVGIGTTNPKGLLEIGGSNNVGGFIVSTANLDERVTANTMDFLKNSAKLLTGWNRSGGNGEADFMTNRGAGDSGGFAFYDVANDGTVNQLFRVHGNGNFGIGVNSPSARLDVAGNIRINAAGAHMIFADNTVQSTAWNGTTCGGDYAESVDVVGDRKSYEPGDVLVIDRASPDKFVHSLQPYSRLVAGIYSTKPGLTGRRQGLAVTGEEVPMAMLGIVPTKVSAENGAIDVGDLLVSSATEGYAMRGTDASKMMGAVIGKAMGKLDSGKGVIEVLVSLQ